MWIKLKEHHHNARQQIARFSRWDWFKVGTMTVCLSTVSMILVFGIYVIAAVQDLPSLPRFPLHQTTGVEVYDRNGDMIGMIGQRAVRTYDEIPETFIQALLATEDRMFFEHPGISLRGMARAAYANLTNADLTREGGSTITMQTVRLIIEDRSPSLRRKIREMVLAWHLDRTLSKEEILTLYSAICYLGEGQYGIEAASRHYFGTTASELSTEQAATLVAMLKAPNNYSRRHEDRLKERRNLVLRLMAAQGHLSEAEYWGATIQDLNWSPRVDTQAQASFILDLVATELRSRYGQRFLTMCSQVHTTLDLKAQHAAQRAVTDVMPDIDERLGFLPYHETPFAERQWYPQAVFVALDVNDNSILAWVGGRDYAAAPFNAKGGRGVATRQPGSAFKTFSYALAMARGISPETILLDAPITLQDPQNNPWSPNNYDSKYYGPMILKQMMVKSLNSMAVRLVNEHEAMSPAQVAELAQGCGITTPLAPHPSLPLGTVEVTPLELASAYSIFARQGNTVGGPYIIRKVLDRNGQVLYAESRHQTPPASVLDSVSCFYTVDALKDVVNHGTARRIRSMVQYPEIAGKTGTSTDYRDAWFVGLTPRVVCSAWIGFDDNRAMINPESGQVVVGGNSTAVITGRFWQEYPEALQGEFWKPSGDALIWFQVNPETGEPDALNPDAVRVPYVLRSYVASDDEILTSEPLAQEGQTP